MILGDPWRILFCVKTFSAGRAACKCFLHALLAVNGLQNQRRMNRLGFRQHITVYDFLLGA